MLFAHSMGGCVGALYLEKYPETFKKAVLSSPMMRMALEPRLKVARPLCLVQKALHRAKRLAIGQERFDERPDFKRLRVVRGALFVSVQAAPEKCRVSNERRNLCMGFGSTERGKKLMQMQAGSNVPCFFVRQETIRWLTLRDKRNLPRKARSSSSSSFLKQSTNCSTVRLKFWKNTMRLC